MCMNKSRHYFVNISENFYKNRIFFLKTFGGMKKTLYLCTRFSGNNQTNIWKSTGKPAVRSSYRMTCSNEERVLWKDYIKDRRVVQVRKNKSFNSGSINFVRSLRQTNIRRLRNWSEGFAFLPFHFFTFKQYFYNGEFDPGSGWTLATGLTHASRGETAV